MPSFTVLTGYYSSTAECPPYVSAARLNHSAYCATNGYRYCFSKQAFTASDKDYKSDMYIGCNAKPHLILQALDQCPEEDDHFVFWLDSDSYFTTFKSLDHLVLPGKDFFFTGDFADICNSGHLLVRNSPFSRRLLNAWIQASSISFPLDTTPFRLTPNGYAYGDQTILSALLGAGLDSISPSTLINGFLSTNGFSPSSHHYHQFLAKYAPLRQASVSRSLSLVHNSLRPYIHIYPQRTLNSYFYGPLAGHFHLGDNLVHFVSGSKHLLPSPSQLLPTGLYRPTLCTLLSSLFRSSLWSFKIFIKQLLRR